MRSTIQATAAYELSAEITDTGYGHHLRLISLVPVARNPEEQVRFQGTFSRQELAGLRELLDHYLAASLGDSA